MTERVRGYCPMGCGETLRLDVTGVIVCQTPACPLPHAVAKLLQMREAIEHRVTLEVGTFQVVHPLRERFGDEIGRCRLDEWLKGRVSPPKPPGVYLAEQQSDGVWVFTPWTD